MCLRESEAQCGLSVGGGSVVCLEFRGQWCDRCPQTAAAENRRSRSLMMDELESLSVWVKVWLMLRGFGTEVGRVGGFGDVSGDPPLRAAG